ncbi:MAG: hypothetical protein NTU85_03335 [Candidatus Kaiserbacteria bacterium]|nr:hypothetical protein [Candidatus Kaiserbacteria bacterium]
MEPLSRIFGSPARLKTLRLFMFNRDAALSLLEVTKRLKLSKEVARSELSELCASGLLRRKGERSSTRYQVNQRFEYLAAIDLFIRETTNVRPRIIISALRRAGTLQLVVLSGFFTGVLESQVDLLIVGDHLQERILAQAVHTLEAELGREIRYASFATADFRYRFGVYDRLLRDIFDYPHHRLLDKVGL